MRFVYTGFPTTDSDSREPVPNGDLNPGESGTATPVHEEHPGFLWNFTSDRGFSMVVPPHDLRKETPAEVFNQLCFD